MIDIYTLTQMKVRLLIGDTEIANGCIQSMNVAQENKHTPAYSNLEIMWFEGHERSRPYYTFCDGRIELLRERPSVTQINIPINKLYKVMNPSTPLIMPTDLYYR